MSAQTLRPTDQRIAEYPVMATGGPFGLAGRRTVVTGAAMGIGRGIAEMFRQAGADVLLTDLDGAALAAAADALPDGPGRVATVQCDISADDAGQVLVAACVDHFGGIDVLVNNAGIYPQMPVLQMSPELLDHVYRVNLRGLILACKAAAARMVAQGTGGRIINIASIDALRPSMVGLAAYDASKGGVLMFTRNLALELAPHAITVNAVAPGGITTEGTQRPLAGSGMTSEQQAEVMRSFAARVPLGRMGVPSDIAAATVFLASSGAAYITGSVLVVDGGALLT
jgi:2-dehydro-3-deoxy-D-gluconate 5-dehydrogenase